MPHDDALVVKAIIYKFKVQKILVANGSKVNLLSYRVFKAMMYDFEVVKNIWYLCMKFPIEGGVATVKGKQEEVQAMYLVTMMREEEEEVRMEVIEIRGKEKEQRTQPVEKLESFVLSEEDP